MAGTSGGLANSRDAEERVSGSRFKCAPYHSARELANGSEADKGHPIVTEVYFQISTPPVASAETAP